ncbi:glycosaminoglycan attachment protein [candidate division KSB1 bacterium]|nr:MAG: glycosaminoglycan attachment protein [candidate division KSB1 bacterium]
MAEIKKLNPKRFDAYVSLSKSPAASYVSKELAWYSNLDESILGVVLLDIIDTDYVSVVLARDMNRVFRAIDVQANFGTFEQAKEWLFRAIRWHSASGKKIFPQGDEKKSLDLFKPIVPIEKQHPYFVRLNMDEAFLPAKTIINEIMPHFIDIDGNFVEQFQTIGFDSRLWELFLFMYFNEEELFIRRDYNAPDFIVEKYGMSVAVEAVIVGRKEDNPPRCFRSINDIPLPSNILEKHEHEMPIRFGSPLYSKLKKQYWELEHVKGKPLVFAIADFHDDQSMLWSSTALINYLYGVKHEFYYDDNGQLVIVPRKIDCHKIGKKTIPSGFFFQTNSEYVSAILFSASGTISKFNRIGRQAGFAAKDVIMIRIGTCHDHDPNACMPKMFEYIVDENSNETWGEGISMFHNPNALYPVPEDLFPSIAHHHFVDGQIVSKLPEFYPYASVTWNIRLTKQ